VDGIPQNSWCQDCWIKSVKLNRQRKVNQFVINNLSLADSIEYKQPGELNALEADPKPYSLLFHLPRNSRVRELLLVIGFCSRVI